MNTATLELVAGIQNDERVVVIFVESYEELEIQVPRNIVSLKKKMHEKVNPDSTSRAGE